MDEWSVGSDGWVMERDGSLPKVKGKGKSIEEKEKEEGGKGGQEPGEKR